MDIIIKKGGLRMNLDKPEPWMRSQRMLFSEFMIVGEFE